MSIYEFTKQKLITHGVQKHQTAILVLTDKRLFLLFVKLERARRLADFGIIHARVDDIDSHTKTMGKPYLVIYAYMYIDFSKFTPRIIQLPIHLDNGDLRYVATSVTKSRGTIWPSANGRQACMIGMRKPISAPYTEPEPLMDMKPIRDPSALIDSHFRHGSTWVEMTKDLRKRAGLDLLGAQRMALAHLGWNARINHSINHDATCRKEALHHVCVHKERSLITLVNGRLNATHEPDETRR